MLVLSVLCDSLKLFCLGCQNFSFPPTPLAASPWLVFLFFVFLLIITLSLLLGLRWVSPGLQLRLSSLLSISTLPRQLHSHSSLSNFHLLPDFDPRFRQQPSPLTQTIWTWIQCSLPQSSSSCTHTRINDIPVTQTLRPPPPLSPPHWSGTKPVYPTPQ